MTFKICAIVPVLGPQPLLQRAVTSALSNSEVCELVVVDDGSPAPLDLMPNPRLRIIRHDANKGPAAARNSGARAAKSDWLAFLDADDVWDQNKSKTQIDALKSDLSGALGAVCAFGFQRGAKQVVCRPPGPRLEFGHALKGARFGLGSTMMISRAAFLKSTGFNEDYPRYEDWEWLLRILKAGHFLTQREQLVTITHGYRAKPSVALRALSRLEKSVRPNGWPPSQLRDFTAAIALERSSLQLSGKQRLAAAWSILAAMRHGPAWVPQAVFKRITSGSVPGV